MFKGRFNEYGQAVIDGLVSFRVRVSGEQPEIPVQLVIDTGSDVTMIVPSGLGPYGYSMFRQSERSAGGYGGSLLVKKVPIVSLQFRLAAKGFGQVSLSEIEVARPAEELEGLPSVLGRDVLDQYRLVIDKSANLVLLERPTGPTP